MIYTIYLLWYKIIIGGIMDFTFGNSITVEEFNELRTIVGWNKIENELAIKSIKNSLFLTTVRNNNEIIGLARVCGDGGYTVVIADVIVKPAYQKKGIGKKLMENVIEYLKNSLKDGQEIFVNLMSAKNKETFYKQFGFVERPNDNVGAGMTQWIKK